MMTRGSKLVAGLDAFRNRKENHLCKNENIKAYVRGKKSGIGNSS